MQTPEFAVVTRSGLRGLRHFPLMWVASMRIKRQLAKTPGCARWASVVAGPREFWTVTLWESRDKMLDFMRSGAHEEIMWLFGKWLRSFWLMRWRPTSEEHGNWKGLSMARDETPIERPERSAQQEEALSAALEALPALKASAAAHGAPTYENSPSARRHRRQVRGSAGVTMRIQASFLEAPHALQDMHRLRRALESQPGLLRRAVGLAGPREHYAIAVLRDEQACADFLDHPEHARLCERWGDRYWTMHWEPENEFGHWDGLRLRRERLGAMIRVPEEAAKAARPPDAETTTS